MNWLRALVRRARAMRDRLAHPSRQRRALAALQGSAVKRVLVMCHGNICRSPFAAAALDRELRRRGRTDVDVSSAGFVGPDRPSPAFALSVSRELGLDLSSHRSRVVSADMLREIDLVVVMSAEQAHDIRWHGLRSAAVVVVLGDFDSENTGARTIRDPWNCDESVFRESYGRIERCVAGLAAALNRKTVGR